MSYPIHILGWLLKLIESNVLPLLK